MLKGHCTEIHTFQLIFLDNFVFNIQIIIIGLEWSKKIQAIFLTNNTYPSSCGAAYTKLDGNGILDKWVKTSLFQKSFSMYHDLVLSRNLPKQRSESQDLSLILWISLSFFEDFSLQKNRLIRDMKNKFPQDIILLPEIRIDNYTLCVQQLNQINCPIWIVILKKIDIKAVKWKMIVNSIGIGSYCFLLISSFCETNETLC